MHTKKTQQTHTLWFSLCSFSLLSLFPHSLLENWDWDRIHQFKPSLKIHHFFLNQFSTTLFFFNPFLLLSPINQSLPNLHCPLFFSSKVCDFLVCKMSGSGFRASIPNSVKKTIQNIKEITGNHSDEDIYAMLKECSMDPNETTQKLLLQGIVAFLLIELPWIWSWYYYLWSMFFLI